MTPPVTWDGSNPVLVSVQYALTRLIQLNKASMLAYDSRTRTGILVWLLSPVSREESVYGVSDVNCPPYEPDEDTSPPRDEEDRQTGGHPHG